MLCPYCSREMPDNAIFCPLCGRKLVEVEPQPAVEEMAQRQADAARIRYEEMRRLRAEEEERLRREAREKALRAEEERLRRREEERLQAELRRRIREEEMERRKTGDAPLSADSDAEIRARLQMEIEEMRRRVEEERKRAEEEANLRREAEERVRRAAEQRRLYEEEQRRLYEEARRRQLIEEEIRRRREAEEAMRRRAEEAERQRLAQRALLLKTVEDSRQRVEALRTQLENVRKSLAEEEERMREAEEKLRICDEQAAAAADMARPDVGVLNDFLKRLRLRPMDVPSHEINRKVAAELAAVIANAPDEGGALLEAASTLIRSIADALVGRFGSLTPMQAATMVKVAYAVADCAMLQMFLHPKDDRVERCMNAIDTIDRLQEIQQRAVITANRRDRWYVLISVLSCEDDRESVGYCASVLCALANRGNGELEQLQQTLSQLAVEMIGACLRGEVADGARRELFGRAVLAELYAQMKFGANGQMGWVQNVVPGRNLMHVLQSAGLAEAFSEALNQLIQTIAN